MSKQIYLLSVLAVLWLLFPATSQGGQIGGPHLRLSADAGATGYAPESDPLAMDGLVVGADSFYLSIFNATKNGNGQTATNVHLLIAVEMEETGSVAVNATQSLSGSVAGSFDGTISSFAGELLPAGYGGGNHGIYNDPASTGHVWRYADVILGLDLDPQEFACLSIMGNGFSQVHFDAYSDNGLYNPPGHDVTADVTVVPIPGTALLVISGFAGLVGCRRKVGRN